MIKCVIIILVIFIFIELNKNNSGSKCKQIESFNEFICCFVVSKPLLIEIPTDCNPLKATELSLFAVFIAAFPVDDKNLIIALPIDWVTLYTPLPIKNIA